MSTPTPATAGTCRLAEGPVRDATRRRLPWVDILEGAVFEGGLDAHVMTVKLSAFSDSGRLFTVRVDTPGLPVTPWAGLAVPPMS